MDKAKTKTALAFLSTIFVGLSLLSIGVIKYSLLSQEPSIIFILFILYSILIIQSFRIIQKLNQNTTAEHSFDELMEVIHVCNKESRLIYHDVRNVFQEIYALIYLNNIHGIQTCIGEYISEIPPNFGDLGPNSIVLSYFHVLAKQNDVAFTVSTNGIKDLSLNTAELIYVNLSSAFENLKEVQLEIKQIDDSQTCIKINDQYII